MGEELGEGGVRIKFSALRTGPLPPCSSPELRALSALMALLEAGGMVPVLGDGLVGGNCAIVAAAAGVDAGQGGDGAAGGGQGPPGVLVSRSGKQPGVALAADDWVLLTAFDPQRWQATYRSSAEGKAPTSDAPLHAAALGLCGNPEQRWGWAAAPRVAVRGHALAEGAELEVARRHGLPISEAATLFSTPADLAALEALFAAHPYPAHTCYVRRGHGFLLLGPSVAAVAAQVERRILPMLQGGAPAAPS